MEKISFWVAQLDKVSSELFWMRVTDVHPMVVDDGTGGTVSVIYFLVRNGKDL